MYAMVGMFLHGCPHAVSLSDVGGHMLSVYAIRFEDKFHTGIKGGIGVGGQVSAQGIVHMAAPLGGPKVAAMCTWQLPWLQPR